MHHPVERFRMVGHIRVTPPLRPCEFEYLTAFAESRRWQRPDGPYAVPDNPLAECLDPDLDLARYATPAEGQPGLACPWVPAQEGEALVPLDTSAGGNGVTPPEAAGWLGYIRDHFLCPGAAAGRPGRNAGGGAAFSGFGFDHALDGAAALCGDVYGSLTVIRVRSGQLTVESMTPGPGVAT
jgi:hypothetical protein